LIQPSPFIFVNVHSNQGPGLFFKHGVAQYTRVESFDHSAPNHARKTACGL
jgi:hypothetical protein